MKKKKKEAQNQFVAMQQSQAAKKPVKKKIDPLKQRRIVYIDYKDTRLLTRFVNEQGKILPARITGVSSKMQRQLTLALKRARHLGLMPFVSDEFKP